MGQNTLSVAALMFVLASKLSEAVVIEVAGIFIALMSVLVFTAMINALAAVFNVVLATVTVARVDIVVAVAVPTSVNSYNDCSGCFSGCCGCSGR